jgi:excisionase family DNA binding protein
MRLVVPSTAATRSRQLECEPNAGIAKLSIDVVSIEPASTDGREPSVPMSERATGSVAATRVWLTYREAAHYCGWSVAHLRNLVSAGQIPVYGRPRMRRFRRDMLDMFLTNPDAAMRKFRAERNSHGT